MVAWLSFPPQRFIARFCRLFRRLRDQRSSFSLFRLPRSFDRWRWQRPELATLAAGNRPAFSPPDLSLRASEARSSSCGPPRFFSRPARWWLQSLVRQVKGEITCLRRTRNRTPRGVHRGPPAFSRQQRAALFPRLDKGHLHPPGIGCDDQILGHSSAPEKGYSYCPAK